MKTKVILAGVMILALLGVMAPMPSDAALITFTDRATFPDNNSVDWGQLGADGTVVPSGTVANAALFGLTVTVSTSTATALERRDQGVGWAGNFAPGDKLIWTRNVNNAAMVLDFSKPIFGGGAQIQRDMYGAFTGTLAAYGTGLNLLGSFNLAGNSNGNADNSAIFMGIISTDANIRRLVFSVDNVTQDFAINKLEVLQCPGVPVPGSVLLLGSGLLPLLAIRRRKS